MTLLWLVVWVCCGLPQVAAWNAALVSLLVCVFLDLRTSFPTKK